MFHFYFNHLVECLSGQFVSKIHFSINSTPSLIYWGSPAFLVFSFPFQLTKYMRMAFNKCELIFVLFWIRCSLILHVKKIFYSFSVQNDHRYPRWFLFEQANSLIKSVIWKREWRSLWLDRSALLKNRKDRKMPHCHTQIEVQTKKSHCILEEKISVKNEKCYCWNTHVYRRVMMFSQLLWVRKRFCKINPLKGKLRGTLLMLLVSLRLSNLSVSLRVLTTKRHLFLAV